MALRRFGDDSSDDLVSLQEFHGLSGMEPGLELPGVAKLPDIHLGHISSWHEMCHIVEVGRREEKQMSRVAGATLGLEIGKHEEDVVLPVRIFLELLRSSIYRASAAAITQKNARQSAANFFRHFKQRHVVS